jgi:hypothetical protein
MLTLFVSIDARPGEMLTSAPGDPPIVGYFQTLGITATDDLQVEQIVREYLRGDLGSELLVIEERWTPDFEGGDSDVRDEVGDLTKPGIWYSSGRSFYGPEDEE